MSKHVRKTNLLDFSIRLVGKLTVTLMTYHSHLLVKQGKRNKRH